MLDRRFVMENADVIRQNIANRHMSVDFDRFLALEEQRKKIQTLLEEKRAEMNTLTKRSGLSVEDKRAAGQALKQELREIEAQLAPITEESDQIFMLIPNLTDAASPVGEEADSETIAYGTAEKPTFDFEPKDHIDLMENARMFNLEAGAKVSGSGFYYLMGDGALLEMALMRFALDHVMKSGFTPVLTPDIARNELMIGAGFVPRGNESNTYEVEGMDASLIATSEITLIGMFANEILDANQFPIKIAGQSHCFRSERAHGSATRGIYRVHQFSKTEMVVVCTPAQAEEIHMELRRLEQEIFDALEIPYRILEIATADLGAAAYRKFDLEAWMPGRQGGSWGEVTSTSNCTEFQARRLKIRYRDENGKTQYAATLNGTAISVCRALIALVENHQQADGSIKVPAVLQPYLNGKTVIQPVQKGEAA